MSGDLHSFASPPPWGLYHHLMPDWPSLSLPDVRRVLWFRTLSCYPGAFVVRGIFDVLFFGV